MLLRDHQIAFDRHELDRLCRRHHVLSLTLFGSAVSDRFDPDRSDLDFLVAFDRAAAGNMADTWDLFHEALEALFGRKVDLISADSLENPYFRKTVLARNRRIFPPS